MISSDTLQNRQLSIVKQQISSLNLHHCSYQYTICKLLHLFSSESIIFFKKTKYTKKNQVVSIGYFHHLPQTTLTVDILDSVHKQKQIDASAINYIQYPIDSHQIYIQFKKGTDQKSWKIDLNNHNYQLQWKNILKMQLGKPEQINSYGFQLYQQIELNSPIIEKSIYELSHKQVAEMMNVKNKFYLQDKKQTLIVQNQLKQENAKLKQQLKHQQTKYQSKITSHDLQVQSLQNEKQVLKKQNQNLQTNLTQSTQKYEYIRKEFDLLKQSYKQATNKQLSQQLLKYQQLSKLFELKNQQIVKIQQQSQKCKQISAQLKIFIEKTNQQLKSNCLKLEQKEEKLNNLQSKLNSQSLMYQQLASQFKQQSQQNLTLQLNNQSQSSQLLQKNKEINQLKESLIYIEQKLKNIQLSKQQIIHQLKIKQEEQYLHIFHGQVLNQNQRAKEYLVKTINQYTNREIKYTKCIYKFDIHNPTTFHRYIDQFNHICTVVRTAEGTLFAAYSIDKIKTITPSENNGLLISLDNQKTYKCKSGKRSMTYDQFFLIYGNSEMRIRMGQKKVFSNFGMNASNFQAQGHNVTDYIGPNANRETHFISYQIFHVIFKDQ